MKKLAALTFLFLLYLHSFACTTFLLSKNGHHVFGRNYDWVTGNGMVMVNARGLLKSSLKKEGEPQATWTAIYGSITFNQYGKEFPTGGMNEKGLVVELMWLDETVYPAKDKRPSLGVLQWIQYQLDCAGTVAEVISKQQDVRIHNNVPLHYLVADATGAAATIEFLNGKMVVHQSRQLPFAVLTNSIYSEALTKTNDAVQKGKATSFNHNSLDRFATTCSMVAQFQKTDSKVPAVDYAFSILDKVAQGSYTKWTIVYDISKRQVHFLTDENRQRRSFSFSNINFNCGSSSIAYAFSDNSKGDITPLFKPISYLENEAVIRKSLLETGDRVSASENDIIETASLFLSPKCK